MATRRDKIIDKALQIIESEPNGMRCFELCQRVREWFPDFSQHYTRDNIILLDKFKPEKVYKPEMGLFLHVKYKDIKEAEKDKDISKESHRPRQIHNSNAMLIPVQYSKKKYPSHIRPKIAEVAAHFDKDEIIQNLPFSIHTEYSYRKRRLDSNLLQKFPTLKSAHRNNVPRLWFNRQWSLEFANFINELVQNKEPVVIEIHPPFTDYSTIDQFLDNYKEFETRILKRWPTTEVVLENRSGTEYRGGRFLISRISDLEGFVNKIEQTALRLNIALDIPQLFTAHGGPEIFDNDGLKEFLSSLSPLMCRVRSIHLWGKRRNRQGRSIVHVGDLNSYFDYCDSKKNVFLNELAKLLSDGRERYFVPEVNSSSEDLQSIVSDLESAGITFVASEAS